METEIDDICWMCHGTMVVEEPVCGWCESGMGLHVCDDTYTIKIPCPVCVKDVNLDKK